MQNQEAYFVAQNSIYYLLRSNLYQSAVFNCSKYYKQFQDPFFIFWKAYALGQIGYYNEAINELNAIKNRKEIQYATVCALIDYHQQAQNVDRESLSELKQMELEGRRMAGDKSLILAIQFYIFNDQPNKSKDILNELSPSASSNQNILSIQGWVFLQLNQVNEALDSFQIACNNKNPKPLEPLMGVLQCQTAKKQYEELEETVNEIIVSYEDFLYGQIEKAHVLMLKGDWNNCIEVAETALERDPNNILGLKITTFYILAREGDLEKGCEYLDKLYDVIEQQEAKNAQLFYTIAQLFSRIVGKNKQVLYYTMKAISQAKKLNPLSADYLAEQGQQYLMVNELEKAYNSFQEASQLDDQRQDCINAMILVRILQGQVEDAEAQIAFNKEIYKHIDRSSDAAYLEAVLLERNDSGDTKQKFKLIEEALKIHIGNTKKYVPGYDFYIALNPCFLLQISECYLYGIDLKSMLEGREQGNVHITKGAKLLDTVVKQIPGMVQAYLLQSKAKMALGDQQEGLNAISKVLELDRNNEDAYIFHALISNKNQSYNQAMSSIQAAISNNFSIRDNALFMLIKAQVEYNLQEYETALTTISATYELPMIKDKNMPGQSAQKGSSILQITDTDRCQIFLLYAKCLTMMKRHSESKVIMTAAISEFSGTSQQPLVLLTNAEIAAERNDFKTAIEILKKVPKTDSVFQDAKIQLAEIYLVKLKDRRHFAKCYFDLAQVMDSYEAYKLLGDSLMRINEPQDAVIAYQTALQKKPNDEQIVRSLGKALIKTYNFENAIRYYQDAMQNNNKRIDLILDYCKLCIKLKRFNDAEMLLKPELFKDTYGVQNLYTFKQNVKGFRLIALLADKKRTETGPNEVLRGALKKSIQIQQKEVLERAKYETNEYIKQKKKLSQLYIQMAQYLYDHEKNTAVAIDMLEEALKHEPENETAYELITTYFFRGGKKDECQKHCKLLLKINSHSDFACAMLAELLVQKDESSEAILQFKKILAEQTNNYAILARLIDFDVRAKKIEEAKQFLEKAVNDAKNKNDPGLCYCWGIYYKFCQKPKEALYEFSKAKKSSQYSEKALTHMIDIYLNPDQDLYYSSVEQQKLHVKEENIKVCETLLKEMQTRASYNRYILMESYVLMMGNFDKGAERAIKNLSDVLKQDSDYIPAIVALAIGKFISDKKTDAKNLLKIISNKPYISEYGYDFEQAWLLYADSFIAIQKYDNAEEILRKCLKYNQMCVKSEEFMGLIKEKESAYVDAAIHYEAANKLSNERSASVIYRLAFNYLKAKRYVDCINVCHKILEVFPDYPQLKKDILQKALQNLQ